MGSSGFWTSIWNEFFNLWPIVIVIPQSILRVLLVIQGDCKWDRFLNNVGSGRLAFQICGVVNFGGHSFGTKATSWLCAWEVQEVISPDFDSSLTILGTVPWVEGEDPGSWIVSVLHTVHWIVEVSGQRNTEVNSGGNFHSWSVFTLNTFMSLIKKVNKHSDFISEGLNLNFMNFYLLFPCDELHGRTHLWLFQLHWQMRLGRQHHRIYTIW